MGPWEAFKHIHWLGPMPLNISKAVGVKELNMTWELVTASHAYMFLPEHIRTFDINQSIRSCVLVVFSPLF